MEETAGRPDAPILLVTKLHPPFAPAQTIERGRLVERLRDGRGRRLTLVACPAALSLAETPDRHGLVPAFDGASAHVVDFLSSEVLAAHEPELQAFMLQTSVLERLCVPLCDAVIGQPVSAGALESLARSNLFLLPLDDRRQW